MSRCAEVSDRCIHSQLLGGDKKKKEIKSCACVVVVEAAETAKEKQQKGLRNSFM
jgi:hypothetical protein